MDLIQSEQPNVPVEPESRYVPETASAPVVRTEHGHTWFRIIVSILVGIVLIILIVLFARWVYHKVHHKTVTTPATSQSQEDVSTRNKTSESQLQGSGSSNSSNSSNSSSNTSSSSGSSNTSTSTSSTNTDANPPIANTGPGNTVAIFVGTSLVAGGLHYIISVRRFAKNRI